ncbi:atp2, beta subunit of the F1 sector of mitochondrial F1F0 ATP synthase [Trifolium repens]|nr:atp2, beta subunit of the F1 sector of mitochondrial F1F0 ATP synthase [Trifolium repens]
MHMSYFVANAYVRDAEGQDVLLFVDNIFCFTQCFKKLRLCMYSQASPMGYAATNFELLVVDLITTKPLLINGLMVQEALDA